MKDEIEQRFDELISAGQSLLSSIPSDKFGPMSWIPSVRIHEFQSWLSSALNLIIVVDQPNGVFVLDCKKVMEDKDFSAGIPSRVVQRVNGMLEAAHNEWQRGLLRKIEHIVVAEAFDDFLDHADLYHKGNKKVESSVLASTVLEDTIKRIAKKKRCGN